MTSILSRVALVLLLLGLLAGCSGLLHSGPEKQYYMLQAQRNQAVSQEKQGGILRVQPFSISQAFEGQQLVIRTEQGKFVSDYRRRFLSPAQGMFTELTRNWLNQSGLFGHVLLRETEAVQADYYLQGRIDSLYVDKRQQQPKTVLKLEFLFLSRQDKGLQILGQKSMRQESELQELSASEAIQAWSQDLELILQDLEKSLQGWLQHNPRRLPPE
ncbi:MAG: ABC-type transport auxiliary lipoprotein family protein [Desulfohalobiaceae bacterium]